MWLFRLYHFGGEGSVNFGFLGYDSIWPNRWLPILGEPATSIFRAEGSIVSFCKTTILIHFAVRTSGLKKSSASHSQKSTLIKFT